MPRMARIVIPDFPHHVTQRGSRSQRTFFSDEDYQAYIDLLCELKADADVDIIYELHRIRKNWMIFNMKS